MNQDLETVLGCILGKGVGWRSLWDFSLQFKILKGKTFWSGESKVSEPPFQFKSQLSLLPSLFTGCLGLKPAS